MNIIIFGIPPPIPKLMIFMILLYTAIFKKRQYLVAAFAISLACAVLRYRLLKVLSVNYLPSRSYRTDLSSNYIRVACYDEEVSATQARLPCQDAGSLACFSVAVFGS